MRLAFLLIAMYVIIAIAALSTTVLDYRRQNIARDLSSACPKTYTNDLIEFHYPCSWLLTTDSDATSLIFMDFQQSDRSYHRSFWIDTASDGFVQCENGKFFSERTMPITTFDGKILEACYRTQHGWEELIIPSDRFETGYISIGSDNSQLESLIPSLKVK